MARDPITRFDRWRSKLPEKSAFLVSLVLDQIVPVFIGHGFERHRDYAKDRTDALAPSTIGLQRRSGERWATVELHFGDGGRPLLGVRFAALPEVCHRLGVHGDADIPRIAANVVEGEACFSLCKGDNKSLACSFGYSYFALFWEKKLRSEVNQLASLLPFLFDLFDRGIPLDWTGRVGKVHQHVYANRGAKLLGQLIASQQSRD